jgi:iron complex transport system ATP-binding protein
VTARVELSKVGVTISGRAVVRDVSGALPGGALVALLGPNGAGKTTLLRAMAGLAPHAGTVRLDGADAAALPPMARARAMAYLPQGHQAHWPLAARDIVALGRYPHRVDPSRLSPADTAIVEAAMARADCAAFADQNVQTLSGGERARVMLARVFAVEAPVLLADEPTAALDPRHQIGVMEALRAEAARGALVVAVTHDIALAARFADRVLLMADGAVAADGAPDAVLTDDRLRAVYGVAARMVEIDGRRLALPWSTV